MTNTIYIHQPEQAFSFTRLPNFLFEAPTFKPLSNEAKVLYAFMVRYNETIYTQGQTGLSCEYDYQKPSFRLSDYGIGDEVFGVISIPVMELEMPIFLGATEQHMADGAAHLSQTSLPIGGENTNCVIAGHRGYNGASYFRYIDKLKVEGLCFLQNREGLATSAGVCVFTFGTPKLALICGEISPCDLSVSHGE